MPQRVKVKLNNEGFRRLRTSPRMEKLVMDAARAVAQDAESATGEEFGYATSPGTERAASAVFPDTYEASREVAKHPFKLIGAMMAVRRVV
jgi:hypothetical protein